MRLVTFLLAGAEKEAGRPGPGSNALAPVASRNLAPGESKRVGVATEALPPARPAVEKAAWPSSARAGLVARDDTVIAAQDLVAGAPRDLLGLIDAGPALWERLRAASLGARGGVPLASARLLAPIPRPRRNVFCVGWNYAEHFAEGERVRGAPQREKEAARPSVGKEVARPSAEMPEWPSFFSKNPATVTGPEAPVWHPAPYSEELDWEVELAVIIGKGGRDIPEERALEHVFGYTIGNDVSVRDVQRRHGGQWFKGKNFDSHCPLGPWIVTADEIGDPQALRITSRINGVTKQDSNTRFMVFQIPRLIRELSMGTTLEPGDIILTGTPSGVGFARTPPEYLKVGDVMELEVERIGVLRNRVEARPIA